MINKSKLPSMIEALVRLSNESKAGVAKAVLRNKADRVVAAIIVVDAGDDTQEIVEAVEKIEASWHR